MNYLLNTTEVYRVDSESAAAALIKEAKEDFHFVLEKYSSQYKEIKQKGEVIDTYYKVSLTKSFTKEKEPELQTQVSYTNNVESAF